MTATLHLNLTDALSANETAELLALAERQGKTLERLIYEAALAAITPTQPMPPVMTKAALPKAA